MNDESWVAKTGSDAEPLNPSVVKYLRLMIAQSNKIGSYPLENGGFIKTDRMNITLYSSGNYSFFENLAKTLSTVLGPSLEIRA